MHIKPLIIDCSYYYREIFPMPLKNISFPKMLSSFVSSLISPFNPYANEFSTPSTYLDAQNIRIIDQISTFGKTLEQYHPGKIRTLLNKFAEKYEQSKENLPSLEDAHIDTLKGFKKIYNNIFLKTQFSKEQKDEIETSFNEFSKAFKALINAYNTNNLRDVYTLFDTFNESVMQTYQLYIGLDKIVRCIESNYLFLQTPQEKLNSIILLKEQFNPELENQGFKQISKKETSRAGLFNLIADVNTHLETLFLKVNPKTIGKNDDIKNECIETILQESEKVIYFMQKSMKKHRKTVFKKIRTYLKDEVSSFKTLQNKLEDLPDDKKAQNLLVNLKEMRFYLKDDAPLSSCNTLKEKLKFLLEEQPYLFTEREKIALSCLSENLSVISNGKYFNKEHLQEQLNQCREIIKKLVPPKTIFSQITTSLSILRICLLKNNIVPAEHKHLIKDLDAFINDPKIPFQNGEKEKFLDLKNTLLFNPSQPISEEKASALQLQKYLELIEEIQKRPPTKEQTKLAIEQELKKLATHATNLTFIMSIDRRFFNASRAFLFYRTIIQKSERLNSCPKQVFLDELKAEGSSTWKIVLAKVCFFVTKHFKIEKFVYTTILRTLTNYSTMIYQECTHDQFQIFSQKLIEHATMYFHLLGSAISNVKNATELSPDNPYSKLINDLVQKSESNLLKWMLPSRADVLVFPMIQTGIDYFMDPDLDGNASGIDLLIRDGLKILYKKLQQLEIGNLPQKHSLPSHPLAKKFAEKVMQSLNEYRDAQQKASFTKIAIANRNHMNKLRGHYSRLDGLLDQSIKNYQMQKKEKDSPPSFWLPVKANIKSSLNMLDSLFPQPSSESITQKYTISGDEVVIDKNNTFIGNKINHGIEEGIVYAITELLENPPSEETLYDWIYQGLVLTNQSIKCPWENKEKQDDVKKEISELVQDISVCITNKAPAIAINHFTQRENLSVKLAEKIPYDITGKFSPVIQRSMQTIVDLVTDKTLYQPKLLAQLGKKTILPVTAD